MTVSRGIAPLVLVALLAQGSAHVSIEQRLRIGVLDAMTGRSARRP